MKQMGNKQFVHRKVAKRGQAIPYYFFCQIISGFEIAPHLEEKDLRTKVAVELGSMFGKTKVET